MRTGILGGTFDPIHLGHLAMAEAARTQARLDRVLFIPAGDPWQKSGRRIAPAIHRLEMVRLATERIPGFEVDRREIDRPGPTYTIDTVESFGPSEDLFLILGADAALGLPTWHRGYELPELATFLVVPRSGFDSDAVREIIPDVVIIHMDPVDVSTTAIRQMVRLGQPFRRLLPPAVAEYIDQVGLYTEPAEDDRVVSPTDIEEQP